MPRFWEGDAAKRPESLNRKMRTLLDELEQPYPDWRMVRSMLLGPDEGGPLWKCLQKALTQLKNRAQKAEQAARSAGAILAEDPQGADEMARAGWGPFPEHAARMVLMWGDAFTQTETPDGLLRLEWERLHGGFGPMKDQPVRVYLKGHPGNLGWWRVVWSSWQHGMRGRPDQDALPWQEVECWADHPGPEVKGNRARCVLEGGRRLYFTRVPDHPLWVLTWRSWDWPIGSETPTADALGVDLDDAFKLGGAA